MTGVMLDDDVAIGLWEEAAHLAPVDRAVRTLAAVAGIDADAAADWPVDERDRALIEARCRSFGSKADLYVQCPACGEALETRFDLGQLLALRPEAAPTLTWSGAEHALRAPTSREVARAARAAGAAAPADDADAQADDAAPADDDALARAGAALARACVADLRDPDDGPQPRQIEASLEPAFPVLNVAIGFTCSVCGTAFSRRFDAPSYLWTDIERLAQALIDDVHRLACAYGWTERDILSMGRRRRAAYLARLAS